RGKASRDCARIRAPSGRSRGRRLPGHAFAQAERAGARGGSDRRFSWGTFRRSRDYRTLSRNAHRSVRYHLPMPNGPSPSSAAPQHGTALRDAKLSLRREMLARRDSLEPGVRASAGAQIVARLRELPSLAAARTLLFTLPFRSEWDTMPLVRA